MVIISSLASVNWQNGLIYGLHIHVNYLLSLTEIPIVVVRISFVRGFSSLSKVSLHLFVNRVDYKAERSVKNHFSKF